MISPEALERRIKGEQARTLGNIAARTELPKQQWWLSFADDEGFRGVVIAHGHGMTEALMDCNVHGCNPQGEVGGMEIPEAITVPPEWTYRVLTKKQAMELEMLLAPSIEEEPQL